METVDPNLEERIPTDLPALPFVATLGDKLYKLVFSQPLDEAERTLLALTGAGTLMHLLFASVNMSEVENDFVSGDLELTVVSGTAKHTYTLLAPFTDAEEVLFLDAPKVINLTTTSAADGTPTAGRLGIRFQDLSPASIPGAVEITLFFKLYNLSADDVGSLN